MRSAAEIRAEITKLERANDRRTCWGAAVGARLERLKYLRSDLARLPVCPQCGSDDVVVGDATCSCNGCGERFATEPVIIDHRPAAPDLAASKEK